MSPVSTQPRQGNAAPPLSSTSTVSLESYKRHSLFSGFNNIPSVIHLLKLVASRYGFTPAGLARSYCRYLQSLSSKPSSLISTSPLKPSALHISEMYDSRNFQCGNLDIPPHLLSIKPEAMAHFHIKFCSLCSDFGSLQHECYFFKMFMVLKRGWIPHRLPDAAPTPSPKYVCKKLSTDDKFFDLKMALVSKYLTNNILGKLDPSVSTKIIFSPTPINIVFKNADLFRFKLISSQIINSSDSLIYANSLLVARNQPIIKPRPVFDFKGSGLNDLLWTMPFSNCSINDAISLINPGDWMAISDFEGYYTMFATAEELSRLVATLVGDDQ